ncbi:MAG: hypothetical protein WBC44_22140 [Planctomycetaceae bacterium]
MRFRGRHQPSPFSTRSTRSRLFRLGLGLVLVFAAIKLAADPATWVWLFPGEADRTTAAPTLADVAYDVRLDGDDGLKPDEFRSEGSGANAGNAPPTEGTPENDDEFIDPVLLSGVDDNTLGLRGPEHEVYFTLLARLRDAKSLPAADPAAIFPVVMTEPDHYRGKPVAIEGLARRIIEIPAGENDAGFETLYELWVFTPESGNNPWRVVATELPSSLPQRGVIEAGVPVRLTGLFFKRQGYETRGHALHIAPLLLAKSVERFSRPTARVADFDPRPWVIGTLAVCVVVFGLLFWRFYREDRAFERETLNRFTSATDDAVATIPPADAIEPEEFFRQLEEEARSSKPQSSSEPRPSGSG